MCYQVSYSYVLGHFSVSNACSSLKHVAGAVQEKIMRVCENSFSVFKIDKISHLEDQSVVYFSFSYNLMGVEAAKKLEEVTSTLKKEVAEIADIYLSATIVFN